MKIRHSNQTVYTPAIAKHIAEWNIITAETEREAPHYLLISAMVFLAFMLDGVVHHLGELLIKEWNEREDGKRPKSRSTFKERNKLVKKALNYTNEVTELDKTIEDLFEFRDSFAHPKKQSYIKKESDISFQGTPLPRVGWQTLTPENVKEIFYQINDYCNNLINAGKRHFEGMTPSDCSIRYGHCEPGMTAANLDLFLYSTGESISSVSPIITKKREIN